MALVLMEVVTAADGKVDASDACSQHVSLDEDRSFLCAIII